MRLSLIVLSLSITTASKVLYENYKVFKAVTKSNDHILFLKNLIENENAYSFLDDRKTAIMVAPTKVDEFIQVMNTEGIQFELIHEDVQASIDHQFKRSKRDSSFSWTQYHTLEDINEWLESLPGKYPGLVTLIPGGKTYENRTIKGIYVSYKKNNSGIFIESGIHANEWLVPATTTYIIHELLTSKDPGVRKLAESYDWYIFPIFNPDGFAYSHATDRMWRKNRAKTSTSCYGVDLNRNWNYMWNKIGASNDTCDNKYAGQHAFSEIETQTMSQYIESIANQLFAYIAFHCNGQLLLIPYGHTDEHLDNYNETVVTYKNNSRPNQPEIPLKDPYLIGQKTINALSQKYGTKYDVGNTAEILKYATGLSMDWVKGILKLPIVYHYEFRDKGHIGSLVPPEQIIPNSQEVLDSLVAMFDEALKFGYPKPQHNSITNS